MANYKPDTEKSLSFEEKYSVPASGASAKENPSAGKTEYKPDTDKSRRFLAKYGMAEYTEDEKKELQNWANLAKRGYGNLQGYVNQLGTDDWASLSKDGYYRRALGQQIQEAQGYLKGLKKDSVTYKDASEYLANLQEIQKAFADRGGLLSNFQDEKDYKAWQSSNDYFKRYEGKGLSYNDIYGETVKDADKAKGRLEEAKQQTAYIEKQIADLRADMYYPETSGWASTGGKKLSRDEANARLQIFERNLQEAKAQERMAEDALNSAQRVAGYVQDRVAVEQAAPWRQEVAKRQEAAKAAGGSNRDVSLQAKAELEAAQAKYDAAKTAAEAARSQNMADLQGYQQFIPDGTTPEDYERQLSESVYWYGDGTGEVILPDGRHLSGEEDYIRGEIDAEVQKYRKMVQTGRELEEAYKEYSQAQTIYNYAKASEYSDLQASDDYQKLVEAGKAAFDPVQQRVEEARAERVHDADIGNVETAGFNEAGSDFYTYRTPDDSFTEEEKNTWYALYGRDPEEAYEYAIGIHQRNRTQSREQQEKKLADWGGKNAGTRTAAFVGSVLTFPTAAWDFMGDVVEYGNTGLIMPRTELTPTDWTDAMSSGAAQALNEKYGTIHADGNLQFLDGKGLGDVYQLGQSIAQSMTVAGLGGGLTNGLFFFNAAKQGTREALDRGADPGQALLYGSFTGAAEVLGETLSVEHLINLPESAPLWLNLLSQAFTEGSEEGFTTILNTLSDRALLGDASDFNRKIEENLANGMDYDSAVRSAWKSWTSDLTADVVGGFLSGGISAGGRQAVGMIRSNAIAYSGEDAQRLVEVGLEQKEGSAAYKLAQKIQEQGTMSELEAQRLTDLLGEDAEAIHRDQRAELVQEAQRRLQEAGLGQRSAARSAETVTRELLGEELDRAGRADRERDFQNETVRQVARQMEQERRTEALQRYVQAQADRTEKNSGKKVNAQLQRAFRASGIQLSEHELEILTDGFIPGSNRVNSYVIAARDGYRLGKSGMTLEQAAKSSDYAGKVYEQQFRHAWELGKQAAGGTVTESGNGPSKESTVQIKGQEGSSRILGLTRGADGKLQARVAGANGGEQTVSLSEIDFGESGLDELVDALKGRADAEQIFSAYHGGMSVGSYIRAWDTAKAYGQATGSRTVESVLQDSMLEGMDEASIRAAFAYGRSLKEQQKAKRAERGPSQSLRDSSKAGNVARSPRVGITRRGESQAESGEGQGARKGGVSYDGGTVGSVKLRAVNRNRLTPKQRAQIRVIETLGKKFGIEFRLFESSLGKNGRYQSAYGMYKDGVIYLDVNAGRLGQSMGQVALVRTAAHELTHYIQDYAEERYQELQEFLLDYLAEWKGKDLGQLVAEKMQRDRTGKLTPEQALDEVVADGCEMMLRRTKVMQAMAEQKPGLFQAVKEWMQEWIQSVKDAFLGVSEVHDEARAVAQMETERLEKLVELWDKGLMEASERAAKSPAREGGEVRYSFAGTREDGIEVYETSEETKALSWKERKKQFMKLMRNEYKNRTARFKRNGHTLYARFEEADMQKTVYGDRESDEKGYGAKINAGADGDYLDLLENMEWFGGEQERGKDTKAHRDVAYWNYFLKTVQIDARVYDLLANVRHKKNGAYVYDLELYERKNVEAASPPSLPEGKASAGVPTASDISILSSSENSNTKFQEREDLPDDRALLMQARAEGRNAESLTAYQKKVRSLEALERKLRRQQDALEAARSNQVVYHEGKPLPPEEQKKFTRDAVKGVQEQIRKTEEQIRRAEKVLADMERKPEMRQELEKALAAWREANPNDAARAIRQMQQERDSLREYVKLLRQEARLTTPENRRMLPSDIRKLARNLVKEGGSNAAVDTIAEELQQLGDFMVEHLEGADTGYFNQVTSMARKIAEKIVSESYETLDENKETREGIRRYLREHTLRISDDVRGDIPDFNAWRKAHMGTLRLGNEGMDIYQAYQDLRSEYGEGLFPEDVLSRSDQLQQILEALDQVQPTYQQMFSRVEQEQAAAALGNEIVDRLLSKEVREKDSMADRAFQQRMKQLEEKYARKDRARQQALENAENRAAWEAAKRDEAEERRREEISLRRQLVAEKVHELRERSIERDKKYRGRIAIDKKVVALSKIMLENSGKRHVPDAWKEAIGNFLASVDTLTQHSGEGSRNFHAERIEALREMVRKQQLANEGREERGEEQGPQVFLDINPYLADMLQPFVAMARDSSTGTITVENLELEQMKELEDVLTAIREAVDKADVMLAAAEKGETLSKVAGETIQHLESLGKGKTGKTIRRFLSWDNLTPVYFFKRFGPAGERVFRELQNGWGKLAMNARQIIDFSNDTYTAKEARDWEQEVHEFKLIRRESDLNGRESLTKAAAEGGAEAAREAEERNKETVKLSTAQIMGLYCLVKREQALGHILGGGIRIWDITAKPTLKDRITGENVQEQAERYLVNAEDIAAITGTLTARQKEVADALQKYMNTVGSAWGNEVSQARYGVDLFGEQNYYPISTDPQSRNARNPDADGSDLFHILNMGFTKNTVKNAKNGIVIHSIFDVFSNHMADMAKYNSMGLPMLDAMKWLNYLDETDGKFTSTRKAMEQAYGKNAERYFLGLIQDLNGNFEGGRRGEDIASKMISFSKVASVGANLRVAALQPTSYVRALAVLDPKYLLKGDNPTKIRQGIQEALQYSGTAVWKDLGFFDLNINANMRDLIKHTDGALENIREKSMWGAEMGDKTTWGRLWNATKAEVQDKTGLSGEALLKATAERFDDVIYQTQVMDSTMTRSHLMRQKGAFASMVTSFMSEPTLSYNLLLDAVSNWDQAKRSGKGMKQAGKLAARAFTVYALSQVAASIVESIFSAMRDDDDYENLWEKWKQAEFGWDGNLVQDLVLHNKLPYVRDVVSILEGWTNKRMDTEWVEDLTRAYKAVKRDMENGEFRWGTAYAAMTALSTVTGLPIANTARDAVALWNSIVVQSVPGWQLKTVKRGTVTPTSSIKQAFEAGAISEEEAIRYLMRDAEIETEEKAKQKVFEWGLEKGTKKYDKLLNAVRSGQDSKAARDELLQAGFSEDTLRSQVRTAVKAWYQGTAEDGRPRIDKEAAIRMLVKEAGMSQRDAEAKVREWSSFVSSPEKLQFEEIQDAFIAGEITAARAAEMRMLYGGKSKPDAQAEVLKWSCEKETGIAFNDLQDAWLDGEISDAEAVDYQMKYGGKSKSDAQAELLKWSCEKETGIAFKDLKDAWLNMEISDAQAVEYQVKYGGKTKVKAEDELQKWRYAKDTGDNYGDLKQGFLEGSISEQDAIDARVTYGGQTKTNAQQEIRKWSCEKETGIDYDDMHDLYLSGELSAERAAQLRQTYGGQTKADAEKEVQKWRCEKETGIVYNNLQDLYLSGEVSGSRAAELRVRYGGKAKEDAEKEVLHWQCEKDTGIRYDDIRDAYAGGQISAEKVQQMLQKYGGYTETEAQGKALQYQFAGKNAELEDISVNAATTYFSGLEDQGITKEVWYKTWRTDSTTEGDKKANGKTISGSKKKKMVAYINSLNLSPAQKDALYLALDYAKSGIINTPWH